MLWMLAQLYETLPEVGDLPKPKLCFFFDEAHLLFDDASQALMDEIERTARLIRSKGVGVYFVTQSPTDVPSSVLSQLGNRVQHALRAFTPEDADACARPRARFPMTEFYDVEKLLTSLGIGEAAVTVLSPRGVPTPLAATRLVAPDSQMARSPTTRFARHRRREPVQREVRRDDRSRLAPMSASTRDSMRRVQTAASAAVATAARTRDAADHGNRHEHHDARPAAARDPAPGRAISAARKAAARQRRAQAAAEKRRTRGTGRAPSARVSASIDNTIRTGGRVARSRRARTSCAASSARSWAAAEGRSKRTTVARSSGCCGGELSTRS